MTTAEWALLGAAPIATALIIFGIVVVRGTKVSEFRQAWIDAQRNDLATLLARAHRLAAAATTSTQAKEDWLAFDMALFRVELRKNPDPNKNEWGDVLDKLQALRDSLKPASGPLPDISTNATEVLTLSRPWLKNEWSRVRFGEVGYKTLLFFSAVLIFYPVLPILWVLIARWLGLIE